MIIYKCTSLKLCIKLCISDCNESIWIFSLPSGEPQGKDGNQKIRDKCKQYLDRVEELQEYLVNKEVLT